MLTQTIDETEPVFFRGRGCAGRAFCRAVTAILFFSAGACWAQGTPSHAGEGCCSIHGRVDLGRNAEPGVEVVISETWSRRRFTTTTGGNGEYSVRVRQHGPYTVHLEATGVAFAKREVTVDSGNLNPEIDFLLTRLPVVGVEGGSKDVSDFWPSPILAPVSVSSLSLLPAVVNAGGDAGAAVPAFIGDYGFSGDTFWVNGQASIVDPFFEMGDLMRQYFEDGHELETVSMDPESGIPDYGSLGESQTTAAVVSNPGLRQVHGIIYWNGGNSEINADPYVLAGQPEANPRYSTNNYGALVQGHPYWPHLTKPSGRDTLALSYNGETSRQVVNDFGVVPSAQERQGNFSGVLGPSGQPLVIYSPRTHQPFPNNTINTPLSAAATALLSYLPAPNISSSGLNYRLLTTQGLRNNMVGATWQHVLGDLSPEAAGRQQTLYVNFNYGEIANDVVNIFPNLGGRQSMDGYSILSGYKFSQGHWITNLNVISSRNNSRLTNRFTNGQDIATELGLYQDLSRTPINTNPMNYGLPNLVFNNFTGMSETQPDLQLTQRAGVSATASWIHGAHIVRFGGDLQRVEFNIFGGTNATGMYIFTGGYTQEPDTLLEQLPDTGSSFADFLLGDPNETKIEAAMQTAYMRQTNYDVYVRDDWKALPNLTLLAGLRYDYYSPFVETTNRLSTLDYLPDFSNVAPVQPNEVGPLTGALYPRSLIRPDRDNFSPHVGLAWAPGKNTTFRSGYGITYTEAQYGTFIQDLAYQPPFAHVEANVNLIGFLRFVTLAYGFGNMADTGNYAINRNYRVPYVQFWYSDLQQSLPFDLVLDVGYAGAKGTRLDVISAPGYFNNQPFASAYFDFENSTAFSNFNALVVRVNRRLRDGLAFEATYAYAHSIDDASSIEAGNMTVAQNWQDILAEEGNSSFDIRHELTASFLYQMPLGHGTPHLNRGRIANVFGNWNISGFATIATGFPLTPFVAASVAEVQRGTHGSVRPNRVPGVPIREGGGKLTHWFNTAAFSGDFAPGQQFGTASRYSIPGPGTEAINLSLSKIINFEGSRSLELRGSASNAFNIVQYSGVNTQISSSTFGYVDAAQPMRQFVFLARYRY
jgi:trimeric autotransporter adhesin